MHYKQYASACTKQLCEYVPQTHRILSAKYRMREKALQKKNNPEKDTIAAVVKKK